MTYFLKLQSYILDWPLLISLNLKHLTLLEVFRVPYCHFFKNVELCVWKVMFDSLFHNLTFSTAMENHYFYNQSSSWNLLQHFVRHQPWLLKLYKNCLKSVKMVFDCCIKYSFSIFLLSLKRSCYRYKCVLRLCCKIMFWFEDILNFKK